jgi:hypothetical protein
MTTPDPAHHLARAAELARMADTSLTEGVYDGGHAGFVRLVIELAGLHVRLASAASSVPFMVAAQFGSAEQPRPECRYGPAVRHAPHDGCPGTLGLACGAKLPHAPHGACSGRDPLAEQQKRGEL